MIFFRDTMMYSPTRSVETEIPKWRGLIPSAAPIDHHAMKSPNAVSMVATRSELKWDMFGSTSRYISLRRMILKRKSGISTVFTATVSTNSTPKSSG